MSGPKKPNAVFKTGDQAIVELYRYVGGSSRWDRVLVEITDSMRTYVRVKAVSPSQQLSSDETEYYMETGQVRNWDRFSHPPRLITLAQHRMDEVRREADEYLRSAGISPARLEGFWKEMGPIFLADQLQKAETNWRQLDEQGGN